jgi:organic hydroperoxide reductase OsmC/OhrA
MSEHRASVQWRRNTDNFDATNYNREHRWKFAGGVEIPAASAPEFRGDPACVDPEEAFVASISSCHMLTFLYLAALDGFTIDSYKDDAVGYLKPQGKKLAVTKVELRPKIVFSGETQPNAEQLESLHHRAHEECFIANSVNTVIEVKPSED